MSSEQVPEVQEEAKEDEEFSIHHVSSAIMEQINALPEKKEKTYLDIIKNYQDEYNKQKSQIHENYKYFQK